MSAAPICTSCDQSFDANGYCPRCEQFECEQPPIKTIEELLAEQPELRRLQQQVRANHERNLRAMIERELSFTMDDQQRKRAAA